MMSYDEKLEKIKNDRILMLNKVKEKIEKDNTILSDELEQINAKLLIDDKNSKEYQSIVSAKELIFKLTEEISKATTVEEVTALRKKVNYYINKIKQEVTKRNIDETSFTQMYSKVTYLRSNISMYLRFLKRELIVEEIMNLSMNINDLSEEEIIKLKKLVSNELRYNKRSLQNIEETHTKKINLVAKTTKVSKVSKGATVTKNNDTLEIEKSIENNNLILGLPEHIELVNLVETQKINQIIPNENYLFQFDNDYLTERIKYYNMQYQLVSLLEYNGTFLTNCMNLLRNISRYNWNKKIIKRAEKDYNVYYHGNDLEGFIDYSKKRNSIVTALSVIFKSSRLSKREVECLSNHDYCKDWIIEFYDHTPEVQDFNKVLIR